MKKAEQQYKVYTTQKNDTWDLISYKVYGDEFLMNHIRNSNRDFIKIVIFPPGILLRIPEIEKTLKEELPPWL